MENKTYNDFPALDNSTLEQLARAYAVAFETVKKEETDNSSQELLTQILAEVKLIREQIERNKRIRLS